MRDAVRVLSVSLLWGAGFWAMATSAFPPHSAGMWLINASSIVGWVWIAMTLFAYAKRAFRA